MMLRFRCPVSTVRWILPLLSIVVVLESCGKASESGNEPAKTQAISVTVAAVSRGDLSLKLDYSVTLLPSARVNVYSMIPDQITYFPWDDGDQIKKGEIVAKIKAGGLTQATLQMKAEIESLDAQIANLKNEQRRSEILFADNVVTRQVLDQINSQVAGAQARRKALDAGLAQMNISADNAVLKAPLGGVIANKMLEVGDTASPQKPLCSIFSIDRLEAELDMIETDVTRVRPGQVVNIRLDAWPGRVFTGSIFRILPYISESTRTNTVKVLIDNPVDPGTGERLLKPGMYGRAEIVLDPRHQVLVVPERALILDATLTGKTQRKAFIIENGQIARQRIVTIGVREMDRLEIVEGLRDGDQIVVSGQYGLSDGAKVSIYGRSTAEMKTP